MTRLFLQLAIKEIEAKGRGTTQLSNNSLRNIAAELSARTGEVITLKQCKNRYGVLKRDWQAWILLADSRRGATGLGMNPVTGTFTTPDHFWANLIAYWCYRWDPCYDMMQEDEKRFFSRKGYATQNIMAVCDFDLTFVFASTGWEGIYHDYSIFKRCVLNPRYRFPKREPGNNLPPFTPYRSFV
ncbi:hypothetical protein RHGRI_016433 [Rhododendron griersonianum]|uniref:Uncharacterized protein n=1 Tax=Rhododendron griersonianum TaxID=479676 RepID=A0AAV6JU31_9ERIC|nr:hypothetical protein RHGRI_016433 [Rhododendron griersonianum]